VFHSTVARFRPGDDTVILTDDNTPISAPPGDPDGASISDLYQWQARNSEC